MSKMHTLPNNLPGDWLACAAENASPGFYRSWIVVRAGTNPNDAFRIHQAVWNDDNNAWSYENGDYVMNETGSRQFDLWAKALVKFAERSHISAMVRIASGTYT